MERIKKSLYRKANRDFDWSEVRSDVARLAGFEPATYRFVAGHSIH